MPSRPPRPRLSWHDFVVAVRANPTLAALAGEGFLTRLGFGMISFALPLYALKLGMNVGEIGLLFAARSITVLLTKPLMAWAADHFGRKPTLIFAVMMRCLVGFLFIFATQAWHLYAIRILHGAMSAARDPSANALIVEHGDQKSMATAFAWYMVARDAGRSLGYALAGTLIAVTGNYQVVWIVAFISSLAALYTVFRFVQETPDGLPRSSNPEAGTIPEFGWRDYVALMPIASFGFMVALGAEMMRGLFPVLAVKYVGFSEAEAGFVVGLSGFIMLIVGPLFAWVSDHISRRVTLNARGFANIGSSLLYIFAPTFPGYFAAWLLDDAGKAAFKPSWGAVMAQLAAAHPSRRARVMTFVDMTYTMGEIFGPVLASVLLAAKGAVFMLGVRAGIAVLTEMHALLLDKRLRNNSG